MGRRRYIKGSRTEFPRKVTQLDEQIDCCLPNANGAVPYCRSVAVPMPLAPIYSVDDDVRNGTAYREMENKRNWNPPPKKVQSKSFAGCMNFPRLPTTTSLFSLYMLILWTKSPGTEHLQLRHKFWERGHESENMAPTTT